MKNLKQYFAAAVVVCALLLAMPSTAFATDGQRMPDSYFDDAVFVGDSISLKLRNYVYKQRAGDPGFLGSAQFLTVGGLGSGNVQLPITADSLHPVYNGEKMMLEDSVAASGAKKVYIMFGMNDIVPYGIDGAIENLDVLIGKILEKSPDVQIAVQSVTPILQNRQQKNLNNPNILLYNEQLEALCDARGYDFLDIGALMRDENGALIYEYCADAPGLGMHLSDAACVPWIEYLRTHPLSSGADLLTPASEEDAGQAVDPLLSRPDDFAEEQVDEPAGESFESGLKQPPQKRDPNRRLTAR